MKSARKVNRYKEDDIPFCFSRRKETIELTYVRGQMKSMTTIFIASNGKIGFGELATNIESAIYPRSSSYD